jgi:hypothetical protein
VVVPAVLKLFFHHRALHRSVVLRTMLAADMREGNTGRIEMKVRNIANVQQNGRFFTL